MNISFHSSSSVSSVQSPSTPSTGGPDGDAAVGSATKFQSSKRGQLLASLQQLKASSSPADFKSTVTSLADEVRAQAKSATGPREAAGAQTAPQSGSDLKAQMDALMQSLIDQVTKAKQAASAKTSSSPPAPDAAVTAATA